MEKGYIIYNEVYVTVGIYGSTVVGGLQLGCCTYTCTQNNETGML